MTLEELYKNESGIRINTNRTVENRDVRKIVDTNWEHKTSYSITL